MTEMVAFTFDEVFSCAKSEPLFSLLWHIFKMKPSAIHPLDVANLLPTYDTLLAIAIIYPRVCLNYNFSEILAKRIDKCMHPINLETENHLFF